MACAATIRSSSIRVDRARGFARRETDTLTDQPAADELGGKTSGLGALDEPLLPAATEDGEPSSRAADGSTERKAEAASYLDVLRDWRIVLFVCLGLLFKLANDSLLPLLTEQHVQSSIDPLEGFPFAAGCIFVAQVRDA